MSSKFDVFGQQIKYLISSVTDLKNENKRMMEEYTRIKNDLKSISNRVNILEQEALECHMEIVGIPEVKNEICGNIIKKLI